MNKVLEERPTLEPQTRSDRVVKRIVFATDLSERSREAAVYAAAIAQRFGASLTLVHVFDPEGITIPSTDRVYDSLQAARRDAEKRLSALADVVCQICPSCNQELCVGEPVEQIGLAASTLNADLVVIASHHQDFPVPFLKADHAQTITRSINCPVLVYHQRKP